MKLEWKSYGDTGSIARGKRGNWIITTDGMWWHLDLRARAESLRDERMGKFMLRLDAERHAQAADDLILDGPLTLD